MFFLCIFGFRHRKYSSFFCLGRFLVISFVHSGCSGVCAYLTHELMYQRRREPLFWCCFPCFLCIFGFRHRKHSSLFCLGRFVVISFVHSGYSSVCAYLAHELMYQRRREPLFLCSLLPTSKTNKTTKIREIA
jgi:uncharacterized membrane protein